MSRPLHVLIAVFAVALFGAGPNLIGVPAVVVYPLSANDSSIDKDANARIAGAIAERMAQAGGIKVIPPLPGVERAKYLTDARQAGADYYVTGFVAGLGNGVSMVLQLVSVQNGIVVFSTTAQVVTFADAAGQADILRTAILRHAGRSVTQIEALPAAVLPTPSPGPGAEADLGKLLGRKRAAATPAAVAAAPKPRPAVALVPLDGSADSGRRDAALRALAEKLTKSGVQATVVAEQAPALACSAAGNVAGVLGGTLDVHTESVLFGRSTTATLRLIERDCAGKTVYDQTVARAAGGSEGVALEHAVDAAVGAYLHPTPEKR